VIGLGVGTAVVALLGPLGGGVIRYHASAGAVNQILGGDVAGFVLVIALFLTFGLHLPGLVASFRPPVPGSAALSDPAVFWLVKFMDLGVIVPVLATVAVGLLRERRWARTATYAVVGWIACLGCAVAGMAVVMQVTGDPEASLANVVAFGLFAVVGLGVAVGAYRPVFRLR